MEFSMTSWDLHNKADHDAARFWMNRTSAASSPPFQSSSQQWYCSKSVSPAETSKYTILTPWLMEPGGSIPLSQGLPKKSLFWAESTQSLVLILSSLRSILILSTHLRLGLPKGLFSVGVSVKISASTLVWCHFFITLTWSRFRRMFTYIYSLLIEKDIGDRRIVSFKRLCVCSMPLVRGSPNFFGKSFLFLCLFLKYQNISLNN